MRLQIKLENKMKYNKVLIVLFLSIGLISCDSDESSIDDEQTLKSYELISIQWKLDANDGQSIVEEKIPEFYFQNDTDKNMEIVIEPLKDKQGSSIFKFNDSVAFKKLNLSKVNVSITKELSLLSKSYSYLQGGVQVPLTKEASFFPFSFYANLSLQLTPGNTLTTNYTLFLRKNKASFLATFREKSSGNIIELTGNWTGLFFDNLKGESVENEIEK